VNAPPFDFAAPFRLPDSLHPFWFLPILILPPPESGEAKGPMAASTVEEITIAYEEEGVLLVKELDKEVLTKGSWTTIMFKYQDLDKATNSFKATKISIRRYQKQNGEYKQKSKFNISSVAQAKKVLEVLNKWTADAAGDEGDAGGAED
jgi:hypothetical protein